MPKHREASLHPRLVVRTNGSPKAPKYVPQEHHLRPHPYIQRCDWLRLGWTTCDFRNYWNAIKVRFELPSRETTRELDSYVCVC